MNTDTLLALGAASSSSLATLSLAWVSLLTWQETRKPLYIATTIFLWALCAVSILSAYLLPQHVWYLLAAAPLTFAAWHWHKHAYKEKITLVLLTVGLLVAILPPAVTLAREWYVTRGLSQEAAVLLSSEDAAITDQVAKLSAQSKAEVQRPELLTLLAGTANTTTPPASAIPTSRLAELAVDGYVLTDPTGKVLYRAHNTLYGDHFDLRASWHRRVQSGEALAGFGLGELGQPAIIASQQIKEGDTTKGTLVIWKNYSTPTNAELGLFSADTWLAGSPALRRIQMPQLLTALSGNAQYLVSVEGTKTLFASKVITRSLPGQTFWIVDQHHVTK